MSQHTPDPTSSSKRALGGRFELRETLGSGGFATVYRAWDSTRRAEVALKVLTKIEPRAMLRFQREAAALARLRHPNIVVLHESGALGGRMFMVEDLVRGKTLAELAGAQGLAPAAAAQLLRGVAEAVHHAHAHGVLHRDLKPSNILVDPQGRPVVIDFGIASLRDEEGPALTAPGTPLGTLAYMAPEQVEGQKATAASDVYALGATLHEALTGRHPFQGRPDHLHAVLEEPPDPPSRVNPRVPSELDAVVLRCLEKDPARRFPDAQALARALDAFLEPPEAPPPPGPPARDRALLVLGAVVAVAATAAALVLALRPSAPSPAPTEAAPPVTTPAPPPPPGPPPAERLRALLAERPTPLHAIRALLRGAQDDADLRQVRAVASHDLLERAAAEARRCEPVTPELPALMALAAELAPDPERQARARLALGDFYARRMHHAEALEAAQAVRAEGRLALEARLLQGWALRAMERVAEGSAVYAQLVREDEGGVVGLIAAGRLRTDAWDYSGSNALAERALALEPDNRHALTLLAMGLAFRGEERRALELVERGKALAPDDASLEQMAGLAHLNIDQDEQAVAAFSRAMRLAAPRPNGSALKWRGIAFIQMKRGAEALLDLDEAVRLRPDDTGDLLMWRGTAHLLLDRRAQAEADWRVAYQTSPSQFVERLPDFPPSLQQLMRQAVGAPAPPPR